MQVKVITNVYMNETSQTIRFYYFADLITQKPRVKAEDFKDASPTDELAGVVDGNRVNPK